MQALCDTLITDHMLSMSAGMPNAPWFPCFHVWPSWYAILVL
jgi:hypothetical protein